MSRLLLALYPLLLFLGSCAAAIPGTYTLQSYNGAPAPFEVGGTEMTTVDLQLNDDQTCRLTAMTQGRLVTLDTEDGCSWSAEGARVTIVTVFEGSSATGTLSEGALTLTGGDDVYVLVKR